VLAAPYLQINVLFALVVVAKAPFVAWMVRTAKNRVDIAPLVLADDGVKIHKARLLGNDDKCIAVRDLAGRSNHITIKGACMCRAK
jgi:hypothetical protein